MIMKSILKIAAFIYTFICGKPGEIHHLITLANPLAKSKHLIIIHHFKTIKMKNVSLFIIATFVFTTAFAQLENTRWKATLQINNSAVNTLIDFRKDTVLLYTVADSNMIERMTYSKDDTAFTLLKIDGESGCGERAVQGRGAGNCRSAGGAGAVYVGRSLLGDAAGQSGQVARARSDGCQALAPRAGTADHR